MKNILISSLAACAMLSSLSASTTAITSLDGESVFSGGNAFGDASAGYDITIGPNDVTLLSLGYYDDGGGIDAEADVGIYNLAGSLLSTVGVPVGSGSGSVVGDYRYFTVPTIVLSANTTYRITATAASLANNGTDPHNDTPLNGTPTLDPSVASLGSSYVAVAGGAALPVRSPPLP